MPNGLYYIAILMELSDFLPWHEVVENVLLKKLPNTMTVNELQLGLMTVKGTIDAVLSLRRLQKGYHAKGRKSYIFAL